MLLKILLFNKVVFDFVLVGVLVIHVVVVVDTVVAIAVGVVVNADDDAK
jgi:hypothetical protein